MESNLWCSTSPRLLLALMVCILLPCIRLAAASGSFTATTYYEASNGSDELMTEDDNLTEEESPWSVSLLTPTTYHDAPLGRDELIAREEDLTPREVPQCAAPVGRPSASSVRTAAAVALVAVFLYSMFTFTRRLSSGASRLEAYPVGTDADNNSNEVFGPADSDANGSGTPKKSVHAADTRSRAEMQAEDVDESASKDRGTGGDNKKEGPGVECAVGSDESPKKEVEALLEKAEHCLKATIQRRRDERAKNYGVASDKMWELVDRAALFVVIIKEMLEDTGSISYKPEDISDALDRLWVSLQDYSKSNPL